MYTLDLVLFNTKKSKKYQTPTNQFLCTKIAYLDLWAFVNECWTSIRPNKKNTFV